MTVAYPRLDYDQHARTVPPDDLWGQVRRTVGGRPVPADQIAAISHTIVQRLRLRQDDVLLDLCCGNGALAHGLFPLLTSYLGVDASPYLIQVARASFGRPGFGFGLQDAAAYTVTASAPQRFTVALCYGSFAYLSDVDVTVMLRALAIRFPCVRGVFLGNLPDRDRADAFYHRGLPSAAEMADPQSTIGIWRSPEAVGQLAAATGWNTEVTTMPPPFFAAHYRFDALVDPGLPGMSAAWQFAEPKSTSNLVQPEIERFLHYARAPGATALFERRLAAFHAAADCVAMVNGFWSLVACMQLLARPGATQVVLPSLTYRRMADAIAWAGLVPRFCEVDAATLTPGPAEVRPCLSDDTALLLAVHPIVGCADVAGMVALAAETGLPLLFDSVESAYEDCPAGRVGGFGAAECFSLHASKLINGFEGGYVTTNDAALAARLRAWRDGGGRDGEGLDAALPDIHAALALAGLDELDAQLIRNRGCYHRYLALLDGVPGLRVLRFDETYRTSFKTIVVELTREWPLSRATTLAALNGRNVLARAYYHPPLHAKPMAYAHIPATLPRTDALAERFMLLPCGHHVSIADVAAICDLLRSLGA